MYGTFTEFGFDWLARQILARDNPDEATLYVSPLDLILVEDVERFVSQAAPLSISDESSAQDHGIELARLSELIAPMSEAAGDFELIAASDARYAAWRDQGLATLARDFSEEIWDPDSPSRAMADAVLLAQHVSVRDQDYAVRDGEVVPRSPEGRLFPGRRFRHYFHGALEAKEGLAIALEATELAGITPEAYLDLYRSVAGLIG